MRITAITRYKHGDLFNLLQKLGWSQSELSRRSGLSIHMVGRICNLQARPSVAQANAIQRAFGEQGEYFDVLECWPETFTGTKTPLRVLQTEEVDVEHLLEHQKELLLPSTSEVDLDELKIALDEVLSTIPENHQQVLKLRFEGMTLDEVAEKMHLSRERVRQIEAAALRKMRHPERIKQLEGFLPQ